MLVLERKLHQSLLIGDQIRVTVTRIDGDRVKIGIEAPREITILREELASAKVGGIADNGPNHRA